MPIKDPEARRAYQKLWLANRRAAFFADKACAWCGSKKDLELDHKDPATKIDHRIWSWSKHRQEAEIAKCQVLCRDHHLAKTAVFDTVRSAHGTNRRYDYGCRCDQCKEFKRLKNAKRSTRPSHNGSVSPS